MQEIKFTLTILYRPKYSFNKLFENCHKNLHGNAILRKIKKNSGYLQ